MSRGIVETARNLCRCAASGDTQCSTAIRSGVAAAESDRRQAFSNSWQILTRFALDQREYLPRRAPGEGETNGGRSRTSRATLQVRCGQGQMPGALRARRPSVPLMRPAKPVGGITPAHATGRYAFRARQIAGCCETFADQAVIAIENSRLFEEVQARTRDLSEALAAADGDRRSAQGHQPLGIRSAGHVARWSSRRRSCPAPQRRRFTCADDDALRLAAQFEGCQKIHREAVRRHPVRCARHVSGRALLGRRRHSGPGRPGDPDYLYKTTSQNGRLSRHASPSR